MTLKLLVGMNLSPRWIELFRARGFQAEHWINIGDPRAKDREIIAWAKEWGYTILTHDLDFGTILAVTKASGPSVILIRAQDVVPEFLGDTVISTIQDHINTLEAGALIVLDDRTSRVRILPISIEGN